MQLTQTFRMGLVIVLASLPALGCAGVPTSHTTMGWRFEVGRPATMSSPAAINQGPGAMALYPLGAVATASPARPAVLAAEPQPVGGEACTPCPPAAISVRRGLLAATAPSCDLSEVCARLERLESRLAASAQPAMPAPMPRALPTGPASEQHP